MQSAWLRSREKAMIVTVFRSRLRLEAKDAYLVMAKRLGAAVTAMPGYISHKLFTAEDGERLTCVEFENEEALRGWGIDPDHVEAKKLGRTTFFSEYSVQICNVLRTRRSTAKAQPDTMAGSISK